MRWNKKIIGRYRIKRMKIEEKIERLRDITNYLMVAVLVEGVALVALSILVAKLAIG